MVNFRSRDKTDYIVIHCADTPASMDIGVKEIRQWHQERGWLDVGYHYVIRRDGTLEHGRPPEAVGAHVAGKNRVSVGICMVGRGEYEDAQWDKLSAIVNHLHAEWPEAKIVGHRELDSHKTCPMFDVQAWLNTTHLWVPDPED